jgi:magnesium chelatase subunit I
LLYVDEVNLLNDDIVDAILDAAAQGHYTVRRGPMTATYRASFALIGSMNPEEGHLRPQILDRFGLRVMVSGLFDSTERQLVYDRVRAFRQTPRAFIHQFQDDTYDARDDIIEAQRILNQVELPETIRSAGLGLVKSLRIHSHRAEFTLFEAARAYAAADKRLEVTMQDIQAIAPMALRMRRSEFMDAFFAGQTAEDEQIADLLGKLEA